MGLFIALPGSPPHQNSGELGSGCLGSEWLQQQGGAGAVLSELDTVSRGEKMSPWGPAAGVVVGGHLFCAEPGDCSWS